jgi:signal transduction histidine kinase
MSLILRRHQEQPQQEGKLCEQLLLMKEVAQESCRRLMEIANRVRRIASLERDLVQQADVNELLRDAIALWRAELDHPKAEVMVDLNDLPPLNCKPQQLGSVFLELLRNATAHLQGKGEIRISSAASDDQVTVRISDNGRGIDPDRLPTLFAPALAVKDGRVVTSNWALFISRRVVLDHGGRIDIHSTEGKGTCVTIRLPHTTGTEAKENAMNDQPVASKQAIKQCQNETAAYFGVTVNVIARMPSCSLIGYRNREFVVETADLQKSLALGRAA